MTAQSHPQPKLPIKTLYAATLAAVFTAYRRVLSPIFAASGLGQCRYLPTCSEYAQIALLRHGPIRGAALAAARLARCHPWAAGGLDPVPGSADPPPPGHQTISPTTAPATPLPGIRR